MFLKTLLTLLFFLSLCFPLTGSAQDKTITLNFDDGPKPAVLKELLPLLEKHGVKANFFVEGAVARGHKELLKKMHIAGHRIENHSWGHEHFARDLYPKKGEVGVKASLLKTDKVVLEATGRLPKFFRPPFWEVNAKIKEIAEVIGLTVMDLGKPDINTLDYDDAAKKHPPETLIARVKKYIALREKKGIYNHVLVFHELGITVKALDILIPYFKSLGYEFKTLPERSKQ